MAEGSGMNAAQLNLLCAAYGNVDGISVHSAPGIDDSNMIGTVEALSWSEPSNGVMSSSATFEDVNAEPKYLRVWAGAEFVEEFPINGGQGVQIVGQDLAVVLQHRARA